MKCLHGGCLDDPETLHQLVIQMLKEKGVQFKFETPKPLKKIIAPFSTPGNNPKKATPLEGRIFGRKLKDLTKSLVQSEDEDLDMLVPRIVVSACNFIEEHIATEGIYRMSGSQARQKAIRKEMESNDTYFQDLLPIPSVLDVANLLKQFLRELPISLIPQPFHSLLCSSLNEDCLLLAILLLPPDHLACLSFLMKHLSKIADAANLNKMTASNLAIVLTPNLLRTIDSTVSNQMLKEKKPRDPNSTKLKLHTEIVQLLIDNCESVGILAAEVQERYNSRVSAPSSGFTSMSEDNLDEESGRAGRRRSKKKHTRQRSGSLSRVLSQMGKNLQKAMGRQSQTPGGAKLEKQGSVHSTPLPQFGGTPDYPSPRAGETDKMLVKRKAPGYHESSPGSKKRTFESTFTPKIRPRSFSVKRFKRKKSEGKLKSINRDGMITGRDSPMRAMTTSTAPAAAFNINSPLVRVSRIETRGSLARSPSLKQPIKLDYEDTVDVETMSLPERGEALVMDLETETIISSESMSTEVETQFAIAMQRSGEMSRATRDTARQMDRIRRRSSERKSENARKPRSPSERRIGVLRKRSKEREEKLAAASLNGINPKEGPSKSPNFKPALTPIDLQHRPSIKLGRGRPNSTSVGLGKSTVVYLEGGSTPCEKRKVARNDGRDKPEPVKGVHSPKEKSKLSTGESLVSLKNDLNKMLESFGSFENEENNSSRENILITEGFDEVFEAVKISTDEVDAISKENAVLSLSTRMENISFHSNSPPTQDFHNSYEKASVDAFVQSSPVTRSQLRRQSHSFEFPRPPPIESSSSRHPIDLRRQSSAFEFRSNSLPSVGSPNVPIYENFSRDATIRDSLRRKNSSVRDLIKRLEGDTKSLLSSRKVSTEVLSRTSSKTSIGSRSKSSLGSDISMRPPTILDAKITEECPSDSDGDSWVDASAFFKNVQEAEIPQQCGRSSIVKMRQEMKGRVQDAATKFGGAGQTPMKLTASARRQSARLGTSMTPAGNRFPGHSTIIKTPANQNRRSTLTGIRTSIRVNNVPIMPSSVFKDASPSYANPTISSQIKEKPKSPLFSDQNSIKGKSPSFDHSNERLSEHVTSRKSNNVLLGGNLERKPKERSQSTKGNKVDRKGSYNSRDLKPRDKVERSTSGNARDRKANVKRNKSAADRRVQGIKKKKSNERRYLTIGYVGEVTRSPLKERQNLPINIRRSQSDQTPNRYVSLEDKAITRAMYRAEEELKSVAIMADIARKHSLKSDMIMSPMRGVVVSEGCETPLSKVRRAQSDRASPRSVRALKQSGERPGKTTGKSKYVNSPRRQRM